MRTQKPSRGRSIFVITGLTVSCFIMGGFIKAFGVFFAAFSDKFEASAATTSIIAGVRAGVYTFVAPLAAMLCDRYTERVVLTGSALLSFTGSMVAAFAPNMETVILGTGVIMGAGMSCFFAPVEISIGSYFQQRKSFAIAFAYMGMSLSQIVMPPVNVLLMDNFGLRGTLILYAGFLLNIVVAAALVKPVNRSSGNATVTSHKSEVELVVISENPMNDEIDESRDETSLFQKRPETNYSPENNNTSTEQDVRLNPCTVSPEGEISHSNNLQGQNCRTCGHWIKHITDVLDFSLLLDIRFSLYTIAYCLGSVPFLNIPTYFFPRAVDYNISPHYSALLITIMGCTDLVAPIFMGILGDMRRIGPKAVFTGGLLFFGISSAAVPLTRDFLGMAIVSAFLGMFSNTTSILHMPISVEMVGVARLPKAIAIISFAHGIVNALSPPLLGYIKNVTASYNMVYVVFAVMLIGGSFLMLGENLIRCICNQRNRSKKESDKSEKTTTNI